MKHEFLTNLNLLEMAENEYKQVNTQYQQSKKIHAHYKKEYKKAVQLQDEQMSILCMMNYIISFLFDNYNFDFCVLKIQYFKEITAQNWKKTSRMTYEF